MGKGCLKSEVSSSHTDEIRSRWHVGMSAGINWIMVTDVERPRGAGTVRWARVPGSPGEQNAAETSMHGLVCFPACLRIHCGLRSRAPVTGTSLQGQAVAWNCGC